VSRLDASKKKLWLSYKNVWGYYFPQVTKPYRELVGILLSRGHDGLSRPTHRFFRHGHAEFEFRSVGEYLVIFFFAVFLCRIPVSGLPPLQTILPRMENFHCSKINSVAEHPIRERKGQIRSRVDDSFRLHQHHFS
jgi:hypothetical protein